MPTSLVGSWLTEAARFVPDQRVLALHGPARAADFGRIAERHLVISTYPLLHRDLAVLKGQGWEIVVLDQAQAVKNPASAVAKHIRALEGRMRLALTGTPLENSLEELLAEGRRVLVFSQFVAMLWLIEADVQARGWRYAWLTGDTVDRDAAVAAFQQGDAPLFLISLKAGGVGLTLTAADTVILYDPWWNPAAERQAMDRAHRIGQRRAVFVHRLVSEGTVEQSIAGLQARKQAMADALFEGEAAGALRFGEDDLASLFGALP